MMQTPTSRLRPQAVADYLWYRFEIQPGQALCVALDQPGASNNYQALIAWARDAVDRHRALGIGDPVAQIEDDLINRMYDAGLVADLIDLQPVSQKTIERLYEPVGRTSTAHSIEAKSGARNVLNHSNVINMAGRKRDV